MPHVIETFNRKLYGIDVYLSDEYERTRGTFNKNSMRDRNLEQEEKQHTANRHNFSKMHATQYL